MGEPFVTVTVTFQFLRFLRSYGMVNWRYGHDLDLPSLAVR